MGVPDPRDWQGCDRAGALGVGHRSSPAVDGLAFGSCPCGRPAPGPGSPKARGFPRRGVSSDAVVAPGTLRFHRPMHQASIGCRTVRARPVVHLCLLLLVGLLHPVPASAQPPAVGAGPDRSIHPAYGYPPMSNGAYGAHPQVRGDQPSFEYVVPSPDGSWDPGRAPAPPPGYTGYPSPDAPAYGALPDLGSLPPALPGGAGPQQGAHAGTGVAQGFRFRGDKAVSDARWHESPSAPGYRFRPVSPEELERSAGGDGWRPIRPDDRRAAEQGESTPPDADAFGYQPDSWFRRYYGERP